jgi:phage N-6-adenine-methyltransferase
MAPAYIPQARRNDWATPQPLFDRLNAEFRFVLDVCATQGDTKCPSFYAADALSLPWNHHKDHAWSGWWFCNPPYGRAMGAWIKKGCEERRGVMLIPARTDVKWFHTHLWNQAQHEPRAGIELRFVKGRVKFEGAKSSAPFPSMIVVIR